MTRSYVDSLQWISHGTDVLMAQVRKLDEAALSASSVLPGSTRKHLVAHVAANADALSNLVRWARTGERTPMYASTDQRNDDIAAGAPRPGAEPRAWLGDSSRELAAG